MVICSGLNGTANLSREKPEPLPTHNGYHLLSVISMLASQHSRLNALDFSARPQRGPPRANVLRHRMRHILADIAIKPRQGHVRLGAGRIELHDLPPTNPLKVGAPSLIGRYVKCGSCGVSAGVGTCAEVSSAQGGSVAGARPASTSSAYAWSKVVSIVTAGGTSERQIPAKLFRPCASITSGTTRRV